MTPLERLECELTLIPNPQERLLWITSLGRRGETLPEAERLDSLLVRGCVSRVWLRRQLVHNADGERLHLQAAADSPIIQGLLALLLRVAQGQEPEQLPEQLPDSLQHHGVLAQLSPSRLHGLQQVWKKIRFGS